MISRASAKGIMATHSARSLDEPEQGDSAGSVVDRVRVVIERQTLDEGGGVGLEGSGDP